MSVRVLVAASTQSKSLHAAQNRSVKLTVLCPGVHNPSAYPFTMAFIRPAKCVAGRMADPDHFSNRSFFIRFLFHRVTNQDKP
jgi:hypothetical protein